MILEISFPCTSLGDLRVFSELCDDITLLSLEIQSSPDFVLNFHVDAEKQTKLRVFLLCGWYMMKRRRERLMFAKKGKPSLNLAGMALKEYVQLIEKSLIWMLK